VVLTVVFREWKMVIDVVARGAIEDVVLRKPLVIHSLCKTPGDITHWMGKGSSCILLRRCEFKPRNDAMDDALEE
jgi:hypothetical protein